MGLWTDLRPHKLLHSTCFQQFAPPKSLQLNTFPWSDPEANPEASPEANPEADPEAVNKFGKERKRAVPDEGCDIIIRIGAWVATNATILGPCEVGEHAVVAAGSVVTNDVPPYHIVGGNPAKVIRRIEAPDPAEA